jgi:mono/diheme cytochrome c family protein
MAAKDTRSTPGRAPQILAWVGLLVSVVAAWALSRPPSEVEQARRHFAELQRQVAAARESKGTRATDRGRVMRLRAQARAANGEQRAVFEAEAGEIEARFGWGDPAVVRAALLTAPLVTMARASMPADITPVFATAANGCAACHLSVATPGFENYPAPFRTHPNLSLYVGATSPHQPSRVGCASCHEGAGHGTTFSAVGHSTLRADAQPAGGRAWTDPAAPGAMLPAGRIEAGCVSCHFGERYQPGAPALSDALATLERGGCYGCHEVPGMEGTARRGPDLRRIRGKLSPGWVADWLADPRRIKPSTWMPRLWSGRDSLDGGQRAEIDAVVAYLFANADDYTPAVSSPTRGDATHGRQLVESVGCLGCHVAAGAVRDTTSLRRTFGQPLEGVGSKTTYAWLFDWVREPSRYSPDTRMPNLRLSDSEAADVASYLQTLTSAPLETGATSSVDDEVYRAVLRRYAPSASPSPSSGSTTPLTGEALQVAAGRAVIGARRCFGCHAIRGFDEKVPSVPIGVRAVWRDEEAAIHGPSGPSGGVGRSVSPRPEPLADYGFGPKERARVAMALTAVAGRAGSSYSIGMPWHVRKVSGRAFVQERNCVGCHVIEGIGGDLVTLVAEPSLGPPLLTPEGSRVQPDWLRGFLRKPGTIRPWLSVRMPTFHLTDDEVDRVGSYFAEIAPPNPAPTPAPAGATAAAGRDLFELLKCQQCHVLGTIPGDQPTSNLAPDLRLAYGRLQPEWVLAWLRNPSGILPGTRMPTFWPDYPKSFYQPLSKDGAAQVRAIRDHLLTLHPDR